MHTAQVAVLADTFRVQGDPRAALCTAHADMQRPQEPLSEPRRHFPPAPLGTELAPICQIEPLWSFKLGNHISLYPESGPGSPDSRTPRSSGKGKPTAQ